MSDVYLTRELRDSLQSSTLDVSLGVTMPPAIYFDRSFYDFESEAIFAHEWLCLGHASWIPDKGDYFTTSYVGEPLIVVRSGAEPEDIRCLSAVCQHKGMLVAEGSGTCKVFRCPYHHWVYGLNGTLAGAPAMERTVDFDREASSLPVIRTEIWKGLIFCNFDRDAEPLWPRLKRFEGDIAGYGLETARGTRPQRTVDLPWNWKVMFENSNDGYHANRLHKGPLHDFCPSHLASWADWRDDDAAYLRYNGLTHIDGSWNPTAKAMLPVFPGLTEAERQRIMFLNIPPTLGLAFTPDQIGLMIMHPEGPDRTSVINGSVYATEAFKDPAFDYKIATYQETLRTINDQDRYVDTLQQIGLQSRFAPRGRLSWQDQSGVLFARWLTRRYLERWPSTDEFDELLNILTRCKSGEPRP